jgi:6-pyruvoyl-tetrahydropterin synthase
VNKVEDWTIDFGEVKCAFRKYLDETYDHKMLLNANDPLFGVLSAGISTVSQFGAETPDEQVELLGLVYTTVGDPTVENFAYAILEWAKNTFPRMFSPGVKVQEGPINGIIVGDWS